MARIESTGNSGTPSSDCAVESEADFAKRVHGIILQKLKLYSALYARRRSTDGSDVIRQLVADKYGLGHSTEAVLPYADAWIDFPWHSVKETGSHAVLYGPPGTGKSYFISALCERSGAYLIRVPVAALSKPMVLEALYGQAKIIRRLSTGSWISSVEGNSPSEGFSNSLLRIRDELVHTLQEEGKAGKNTAAEVDSFLRMNIPDMDALLSLCVPFEENDCQTAYKLRDRFSSTFGSERAAVKFSTLARYFPGIPVLFFIDEIDAVGGRKVGENPGLNAIFTSIDSGSERRVNAGISFVAATNDAELLDTALVRKGRMDLVLMPYPDAEQRGTIAQVMAPRFSDSLLEVGSDIENILKKLPMLTGADVNGALSDLARALRFRTGGSQKLAIDSGVLLGYLSGMGKMARWLSSDPALSVHGYDMIFSRLRGEELKEPALYTAYKQIAGLKEQLLKELDLPSIALDEASDEQKFNALVMHYFPNIYLLRCASELLALHYSHKIGTALMTPSDDIADMLAADVQFRILNSGLVSVVAEAHMDRLLYGIVGTTRKNVDGAFAKLLTMQQEAVVILRSMDALLSSGEYVGEWSGALLSGINNLKFQGATVIGCGSRGIVKSAFDGMLLYPFFTRNEATFLAYMLFCQANLEPCNQSLVGQILTNRREDEGERFSIPEIVGAARSGEIYSVRPAQDLSAQFERGHSLIMRRVEAARQIHAAKSTVAAR